MGVKNAETAAGDLSGGEKARLLFSLVGFHKPHLLVLDEPANHLDIDSRAELIKSLNAYEGAVLIISHDRNLLESVVDRLWLVDKGTITTFEGSLEDYRKLQLEKHKTDKNQSPKTESKRKSIRKNSANARKRVAPLKKAHLRLEKEIAATQTKLSDIDSALSAPDLFTKDPEKAVKLGQERAALTGKIETLEGQWLKSLEVYEIALKDEGLA